MKSVTTIKRMSLGKVRSVLFWLCGATTVSLVFVSLNLQQSGSSQQAIGSAASIPRRQPPVLFPHALVRPGRRSSQTADEPQGHDTYQRKERTATGPPAAAKLFIATHTRSKRSHKQSSHSDEHPVKPAHHSKLNHSQRHGSTSSMGHHRLPLTSLIRDQDRGVTGDVSFLLDWAIIGHAKSATSFIMKWLNKHPEVATWDEEVCDLFDNRPAGLVKRLYDELPKGNYKRGFKCPGHFSRRSIRYFKRYFHKTKVIVGVRHPVRWFESFYNFRMRHAKANYSLPEPNQLIGLCTPEKDGVCTDRANFHTNLAVFGKTNLLDPDEQHLIHFRKYTYESTYRIDNPLFLYDVAQFYDANVTRAELFKTDLQHFLGLQAPMPEPTKKDAAKSSRPKPKALDICKEEYSALRNELLHIGKRASMWIRKYFLKADTVFVSSPEHLENILKEWKDDPCTQKLQFDTNTTVSKS